MHATFVTLWLQVMQPLANVHETKWTPHFKRESDVAVHIIAVPRYSLRVSSHKLWVDLLIVLLLHFTIML